MDPNSRNQQWSEWTFTVTHAPNVAIAFGVVKENVARFLRKLYGSASQMKIDRTRTRRGAVKWVFKVQAEAANVTDSRWRGVVQESVSEFMFNGFGPSAVTRMEVRLLAGRPDDGKPAAQWLIMPPPLRFTDFLPVEPSPEPPDGAIRLGMPTLPSGLKMLAG